MKWIFPGLATLLLTFSATAAEVSGKFVSYDSAKKELTVDVDGTKRSFPIPNDVKVVTANGGATKKGVELLASPKIARTGAPMTLVTIEKEGKEVVTEIKLGGKKK